MKENRFLRCKDYLVSGEEFDLIKKPAYEILKTNPVPDNLSSYYESEDYISHTDASKGITEKLYQGVKQYMLQKKMSWIENHFSSGKLLDFGAGTAEFLQFAKNRNWEIHGVEPNQKARTIAQEKEIILKSDLKEISEQDFSVISLWHVLEHLPDLENKIQQFINLLADDGILVIAVPNFKSYDAQFYKEFWAAYDVPRHIWHFSRQGIEALFSNFGFELMETRPLIFDAYYVSLLSEKHKTGKQNYLQAVYRGWKSNQEAAGTGEYSSLTYFFRKKG